MAAVVAVTKKRNTLNEKYDSAHKTTFFAKRRSLSLIT
ncbi:hypothetical protein BLGI_3770 [Brevibacillus laterosporus GI-9]|nr:hypothetical protein BLGI_3770 [Brevibacillus laterosporus GI-9]